MRRPPSTRQRSWWRLRTRGVDAEGKVERHWSEECRGELEVAMMAEFGLPLPLPRHLTLYESKREEQLGWCRETLRCRFDVAGSDGLVLPELLSGWDVDGAEQ